MAEFDIAKTTASDMTNLDGMEVTVDSKELDSAQDQKETTWMNSRWAQQWGYFNNVPELKSAIIMKAIWNVGKGWRADDRTTVILEGIRGIGWETFDDILFNMEIIKRVGGDAYAEIMRDDDGTLINLKPLNPGTIKHVVNSKGILIRYEQVNKVKGQPNRKIMPQDMLHLSHNRLADQIHGISDIDALEKTILAEYENFDDMKKVMHRQAKPMIMFKLKTDDQTEINSFIAKMDKATKKGENIYIPYDKNSVDYEVIQVDVSAMIIQWRAEIRNKFYRAVGMPQIIFGATGGTTESGGKMEYLSHETVFEHDQRKTERDIWNQLALKIDLIPPQSLLDNLQTDEKKDANQGLEVQPQDVTAGKG